MLNGNTTTYGPEPVKADGTVSFPGILVGSTCAPAEAPIDAGDGLADPSYAWGPPTFSAEQTLTNLAVSYDFTVTNHVERVFGTLALEKVLEDPDHVVAPTRTYSGTWSCTRTGDPAVSGTWTVTGPGPATLTGVPAQGILLGSTCTPTEAALAAPPSAPIPRTPGTTPTSGRTPPAPTPPP